MIAIFYMGFAYYLPICTYIYVINPEKEKIEINQLENRFNSEEIDTNA